MAAELSREQTLAGVNDKELREAFVRALDNGWTASRTGAGRFKFTHPDATESVFAPSHAGGLNSVANFEARLKRALPPPDMPPDAAGTIDMIREVHFVQGDVLTDAQLEAVRRRYRRWIEEFDIHSAHSHYEGMSLPKLHKHLEDKHQFKRHFGVSLKGLDRETSFEIHDILHDGKAIKERPKPKKQPKTPETERTVAEPVRTEPSVSADPDPSDETVLSSQDDSESFEPSADEEERSMGEVVALKPGDEDGEDGGDRHFGSMQRAVLAVLHEFPGVAMTVEECTDLCVDDLDTQQVGGALWRCSRIAALNVARVGKGVYRYDPPEGAPNLAVIDRERAGTPTPPAKPRPGVDEPDASSAPGAAPRSEPVVTPSGASISARDDILFEVVLRAEDGSLVLRASDGTVWNAKKI